MKLPVPNRIVRSLLTPPKRSSFRPTPPWASSNPLRLRSPDIRTKMAVVRLRQRNLAKREGKRPEKSLLDGPRGSDKWPQRPAFCAIPARIEPALKRSLACRSTGLFEQSPLSLPCPPRRTREQVLPRPCIPHADIRTMARITATSSPSFRDTSVVPLAQVYTSFFLTLNSSPLSTIAISPSVM